MGTAGGGDLFPVVAVVLILRPVPPSDEELFRWVPAPRRLEKPGVYRFCAENASYAVDSSGVGLVAEVLVWDDWPRFLGLFVSAM